MYDGGGRAASDVETVNAIVKESLIYMKGQSYSESCEYDHMLSLAVVMCVNTL